MDWFVLFVLFPDTRDVEHYFQFLKDTVENEEEETLFGPVINSSTVYGNADHLLHCNILGIVTVEYLICQQGISTKAALSQ